MNVRIPIPLAEEVSSVCLPAKTLSVIMPYVVVCEKEAKTMTNKRTKTWWEEMENSKFHVVNVSHVDKNIGEVHDKVRHRNILK